MTELSYDTPPAQVALRMRWGQNVNTSICSVEHGRKWLIANGARIAEAEFLNDPVTPHSSCTACGFCGITVSVPTLCRWHDCAGIDCPEWDWTASTLTSRAIPILRDMNGGQEFTDRFWAYAAEAADTVREGRHGWPALKPFVQAVWDTRLDWQ